MPALIINLLLLIVVVSRRRRSLEGYLISAITLNLLWLLFSDQSFHYLFKGVDFYKPVKIAALFVIFSQILTRPGCYYKLLELSVYLEKSGIRWLLLLPQLLQINNPLVVSSILKQFLVINYSSAALLLFPLFFGPFWGIISVSDSVKPSFTAATFIWPLLLLLGWELIRIHSPRTQTGQFRLTVPNMTTFFNQLDIRLLGVIMGSLFNGFLLNSEGFFLTILQLLSKSSLLLSVFVALVSFMALKLSFWALVSLFCHLLFFLSGIDQPGYLFHYLLLMVFLAAVYRFVFRSAVQEGSDFFDFLALLPAAWIVALRLPETSLAGGVFALLLALLTAGLFRLLIGKLDSQLIPESGRKLIISYRSISARFSVFVAFALVGLGMALLDDAGVGGILLNLFLALLIALSTDSKVETVRGEFDE